MGYDRSQQGLKNGFDGYSVKNRIYKSSGFTLIELMIVIAIVAILVTLAVPAYQDYTIRAKVTECIAATAPPKIQITEYYQTVGVWPSNANQAGINVALSRTSGLCEMFFYNPGRGDYAIRVDTAAVGASASFNILPIMSPTESTGAVKWLCTRGITSVAALKYLPSSCRGENIF
jgi:type IV pilus assembly protein PilA